MAPKYHSEYVARLDRRQNARWKLLLDVQAPYRRKLQSLQPGYTLEIGCGIGRNLRHLAGNAVGVDVDDTAVRLVRNRLGYTAYTPDDFAASKHASAGAYDSLLYSHVLEHLDERSGLDLVRQYVKYLRPEGRIIIITPQERGFRSDDTHVRFVDDKAVRDLALECSLKVMRIESFPLPRFCGRIFTYNEFVATLRR